jgi:hypothetical protein
MFNLPTLIIGFSRFEGVRRLVNSCADAGVKKIYISLDGHTNKKVEGVQKEILEFVNDFQEVHPELAITVKVQGNNLGVGANVIKSIDWFFSLEEKGIILEDDLELSQAFFDFLSLGVDYIHDFDEILLVSGTNVFKVDGNPDGVEFSTYPMIWGWGTWGCKWQHMRHLILNGKVQRNRLDVFSKTTNFWSVGARRVRNGLVDTWDIPLAAAMHFRREKCLIPAVNLVSNVGFDSQSTHTREAIFPLGLGTRDDYFPPFNFAEKLETELRSRDNKMEREVFGISQRHLLLPIWAFLTDKFQFPKRKLPLRDRLT